jgi:hypothetical protein
LTEGYKPRKKYYDNVEKNLKRLAPKERKNFLHPHKILIAMTGGILGTVILAISSFSSANFTHYIFAFTIGAILIVILEHFDPMKKYFDK